MEEPLFPKPTLLSSENLSTRNSCTDQQNLFYTVGRPGGLSNMFTDSFRPKPSDVGATYCRLPLNVVVVNSSSTSVKERDVERRTSGCGASSYPLGLLPHPSSQRCILYPESQCKLKVYSSSNKESYSYTVIHTYTCVYTCTYVRSRSKTLVVSLSVSRKTGHQFDSILLF